MLLHIISRDEMTAAEIIGVVAPESLTSEGFVHCSYEHQVLTPANERFAGRTDLLLLVLVPDLIPHPLVVEDSYGSGIEFPHIYGPIPVEAIERRVAFPPNHDGTFTLPADLDVPSP